jgi:hypothetical protein
MGRLLSVIVDGFLDIWGILRRKQRDLDEGSVVGQSEFEREGPGPMWAAIIGAGMLSIVVFFVLRR